jgi:hypothetical protein
VLISLWLFLFPIFVFAAQPKEFFWVGLKKLEQRNYKCVELREGIYRVEFKKVKIVLLPPGENPFAVKNK